MVGVGQRLGGPGGDFDDASRVLGEAVFADELLVLAWGEGGVLDFAELVSEEVGLFGVEAVVGELLELLADGDELVVEVLAVLEERLILRVGVEKVELA